jgi:predicted permease
MNNLFANPVFWAALAGLLAALGWEIPDQLTEHILGAVGAISGIIGIIMTWRGGSSGN